MEKQFVPYKLAVKIKELECIEKLIELVENER